MYLVYDFIIIIIIIIIKNNNNNGLRNGDEHPAYAPLEYYGIFTFILGGYPTVHNYFILFSLQVMAPYVTVRPN